MNLKKKMHTRGNETNIVNETTQDMLLNDVQKWVKNHITLQSKNKTSVHKLNKKEQVKC